MWLAMSESDQAVVGPFGSREEADAWCQWQMATFSPDEVWVSRYLNPVGSDWKWPR